MWYQVQDIETRHIGFQSPSLVAAIEWRDEHRPFWHVVSAAIMPKHKPKQHVLSDAMMKVIPSAPGRAS